MILMFIEHDESAGCCRLFFDVPPKGKDCHGVHLWPGELEMMAKVLGVTARIRTGTVTGLHLR